MTDESMEWDQHATRHTVRRTEAINVGKARHVPIYKSTDVERLEHEHRRAVDIVNGVCKDDGAGAIDCPIMRQEIYANRLKKAREHAHDAENISRIPQ